MRALDYLRRCLRFQRRSAPHASSTVSSTINSSANTFDQCSQTLAVGGTLVNAQEPIASAISPFLDRKAMYAQRARLRTIHRGASGSGLVLACLILLPILDNHPGLMLAAVLSLLSCMVVGLVAMYRLFDVEHRIRG